MTRDNIDAGPGDYKVAHTSGLHRDSVGRGRRVPVEMLPDELRDAMNDCLTTLGYPALSASWNALDDLVAQAPGPSAIKKLGELMAGAAVRECRTLSPSRIAVVADDDRESRWLVDFATRQIVRGDGDVDAALLGSVTDLIGFWDRSVNAGTLLRSGRVRIVAPKAAPGEPDVPEVVRQLLDEVELTASVSSVERAAK